MNLDMQQLQLDYEKRRGKRELGKWIFSIFTLGLGALFLWAKTRVIKEGYIGLRSSARGEMILLPPGRHSIFPWENYPVVPQSLAKSVISLGPYTIVTVATGDIAKTLNKGTLEILDEGQHLLTDAAHIFKEFIAIKQETKRLDKIIAYTSDNVGLELQADVRYQIIDPQKAISLIDDIEKSIKEIAEMAISQTIAHHTLEDFAPAMSTINNHSPQGMGELIKELVDKIKTQFETLGINLINIGITSWNIRDAKLAQELAQGAVMRSQTQSKMLSAQREADILAISSQAQANTLLTKTAAEAKAIEMKGEAIEAVAKKLVSPGSKDIYERSQQIELVQFAKQPTLFFNYPLKQATPQMTMTTPVISNP